jgi:hypothetical protein
MALVKPLIWDGTQIRRTAAGDTIDAPQSGGDVVSQTNDEAGAIVIGAPVYNDVADGVKKAKADASGTKSVMGLVKDASIAAGVAGIIQTNGILTATTTQWDAVAGTTGGLAVGARYYLSAATAGLLTATAPSAAGQYVVEVGIAISATELKVDVKPPILL